MNNDNSNVTHLQNVGPLKFMK